MQYCIKKPNAYILDAIDIKKPKTHILDAKLHEETKLFHF